MRLKVFCVLCVAVLALTSLVGCQAAARKVAEKATGVSVNEDSGKVVVTGKEGEKVEIQGGDTVSLPEGFPKDVPTYENATLKVSNSMTTEGKTTYSVSYETSDDVDTVHAWYKDALPKNGWALEGDVVNNANGQSMAILGGKKGEAALNVSVISGTDGSKTTISLTAAQ